MKNTIDSSSSEQAFNGHACICCARATFWCTEEQLAILLVPYTYKFFLSGVQKFQSSERGRGTPVALHALMHASAAAEDFLDNALQLKMPIVNTRRPYTLYCRWRFRARLYLPLHCQYMAFMLSLLGRIFSFYPLKHL